MFLVLNNEMKEDINKWIEKYRYGIIYLEYKTRNKAQWIQMVEIRKVYKNGISNSMQSISFNKLEESYLTKKCEICSVMI